MKMQPDTVIQALFNVLKEIKWRECESNDNFEWYYAEAMHYIVHEKATDSYYFVKAKSPNNAYETVRKKIMD